MPNRIRPGPFLSPFCRRLETEKRGIRQAVEVIGIHDGGNWIDPLWEEHFGCHQRIIDYYHAAEHLHEVSKAAHPSNDSSAKPLAEELVKQLWNGELELLLTRLRELSSLAGAPIETVAAATAQSAEPRGGLF